MHAAQYWSGKLHLSLLASEKSQQPQPPLVGSTNYHHVMAGSEQLFMPEVGGCLAAFPVLKW